GGGGEQCQFYSDDEHGHGLDFGDHFGDLRRDKEHYPDGYAGVDALSSEPEPDECGGREHVAGDGDVERDSTGGRSSGDADQQQHRGSDGSGQCNGGGGGEQCQFYSDDEHGHGLDFGDHFGDLRRDKEHYPDGYAGDGERRWWGRQWDVELWQYRAGTVVGDGGQCIFECGCVLDGSQCGRLCGQCLQYRLGGGRGKHQVWAVHGYG